MVIYNSFFQRVWLSILKPTVNILTGKNLKFLCECEMIEFHISDDDDDDDGHLRRPSREYIFIPKTLGRCSTF